MVSMWLAEVKKKKVTWANKLEIYCIQSVCEKTGVGGGAVFEEIQGKGGGTWVWWSNLLELEVGKC